MGSRRSAPTRFASNRALFAWMEDLYLSQLLLRRPRPMPARWRSGQDVQLAWIMPDPEGSARVDRFDLTATGVTRWTLDGELDLETEISVEPTTSARGCHLVMTTPGRLVLRCRALEVTQRKATVTFPPRPHAGAFLLWGTPRLSPAALVAACGDGLALLDHAHQPLRPEVAATAPVGPFYETQHVVPAGARSPVLVSLRWMVAITTSRLYVEVRRGAADDATWRRFAWLPTRLDGVEVISGSARADGPGWSRFADLV